MTLDYSFTWRENHELTVESWWISRWVREKSAASSLENTKKIDNSSDESRAFIHNNGNIVVSVSDNSIGIPKDKAKKLFTKFTRASNATDMHTDGTGLGLHTSIVKKSETQSLR